MSYIEDAATFITNEEGFTPRAMWDVNAYRIGVGSDTITLPNGTYRKVKNGDTTTRELATIDLARRIPNDFLLTLKKQIGEIEFNRLSDGAKVALLSLAYNYGSITKKAIRAAAKSGNEVELKKQIVEATKNDNEKLPESQRAALRRRRQREADLIIADNRTQTRTNEAETGGGMFGFIIVALALWGCYRLFFA